MNFTIKNGYKISKLTLGTVQLGLPYGINNTQGMPSFKNSSRILQTALDSGICSFDTAKGYGKSEEVLGKFFSGCNAEKTIITKVRFEKETKDEIYDSLFAQVRDSASKLGLEKLPFVMLHSESFVYKYGNVLYDALSELKKEGLAENIGISFSDRTKMDDILSSDVFDHIQISQNIFDCNEILSGKIQEYADANISIFIRSIYLQGLFFMDTDKLPEKIKSAKPSLDKLHKIAKEENMSVSQLALSFIKDEEGVASLVLGCETPEQLLDSVEKFKAKPISSSLRAKLLEISEEIEPIVIRPWEWNK